MMMMMILVMFGVDPGVVGDGNVFLNSAQPNPVGTPVTTIGPGVYGKSIDVVFNIPTLTYVISIEYNFLVLGTLIKKKHISNS